MDRVNGEYARWTLLEPELQGAREERAPDRRKARCCAVIRPTSTVCTDPYPCTADTPYSQAPNQVLRFLPFGARGNARIGANRDRDRDTKAAAASAT